MNSMVNGYVFLQESRRRRLERSRQSEGAGRRAR
jgi:hypothetical protein